MLLSTSQVSWRISPWFIIGLFVFVTMVCLAAGLGKVLNILFPLGSFLVASYLIKWHPLLYIGFNWWLYFLAPFIRRVSDFRGGFTDPSPILLAPYIASLVAILVVSRKIPDSYRTSSLPFSLAIIGIAYSFSVGVLNFPLKTALIGLLDWLSPVVWGFYIFLQWRNYPSLYQNFQKVFLFGILTMGTYGIIQFTICPQWEIFWFESSYFGGQGNVEALNMRVYSTMNSVEPFVAYMAPGLLSLLTIKSPLTIPASIVGYLTFLLSLGRSGWIGWLAGLIALGGMLKVKQKMRIFLLVVLLILFVIPLANMEPFSDLINSRVSTLLDLQNDGSAVARQGAYSDFSETVLFDFLGNGIGSNLHDSAFLSVLSVLGWLGAIPYVSGILMISHKIFHSHSHLISDASLAVIRAMLVTALVRLPLNNPMVEISGIVFWGILGLGLASVQYSSLNEKRI